MNKHIKKTSFLTLLTITMSTSVSANQFFDGVKNFFAKPELPETIMIIDTNLVEKLNFSPKMVHNIQNMGSSMSLSRYATYKAQGCTAVSDEKNKAVLASFGDEEAGFFEGLTSEKSNQVKQSTLESQLSKMLESFDLKIENVILSTDEEIALAKENGEEVQVFKEISGKLFVKGNILKQKATISFPVIQESVHEGYDLLMSCYKAAAEKRTLLD